MIARMQVLTVAASMLPFGHSWLVLHFANKDATVLVDEDSVFDPSKAEEVAKALMWLA
jgi:hypothetical protein